MRHLRRLKRVAATALCIALMGGSAVTADNVYASYIDTINSAQSEIERIRAERKETEDMLEGYKSGKENILSAIEKLDKKISGVTKNVVDIKGKIKKNKKNIKTLEGKIEVAEGDIQNQYETMKRRIKYMYENGNSDYIDILLASKSLSDLLNRSEYIEKISSYDSNMLTGYVEAKNKLEEKKQNLKERRRVLLEEKKELAAQKKTLNKVMDKKNEELGIYNDNISSAEQQIGEYAGEIEKQDRIIENALLEEQKRIAREEQKRKEEEEKAAKAAQAAQNDNKDSGKGKDEKDADDGEDGDNGEDGDGEGGEDTPSVTQSPSTGSVSTGGFRWPLPVSGTITSSFGSRTSPTQGASSYHQGIDISAPAGTAILAAKAGTVVTASYSSVSGNYIMINHGDGVFTVYMHASSLAVSKGQQVSAGTTVAYVGSTGVSTGAHLHFGVSIGGKYVNPLNYVSR